MQISSLPIPNIPQARFQRQDSGERGQSVVDRESRSDVSKDSASQAAQDADFESLEQTVRSVESTAQTQEVSSRQSSADEDDLTLSARKALQAFANNSPSTQQKFGVELAGIDTFV